MNSVDFPESNRTFGPPPDCDESQVRYILAFTGALQGGNLDGSHIVVTAWKPTPEELQELLDGGLVYLTFLGGLPPHLATTSFKQAINL